MSKTNNYLVTFTEVSTMGFTAKASWPAGSGSYLINRGEVDTYWYVRQDVTPYSGYTNKRYPRYQDLQPTTTTSTTSTTTTTTTISAGTFTLDAQYGINITGLATAPSQTLPSFTFPHNSGTTQEILTMTNGYSAGTQFEISLSGTRTPNTTKSVVLIVNGVTVACTDITSNGSQTKYLTSVGAIAITDNVKISIESSPCSGTTTTTSTTTTTTTTTAAPISMDWFLTPNNGGGGELRVYNGSNSLIFSQTTSGVAQSGTFTCAQSQAPLTIEGAWTAGSGNIVRYRICDSTPSELYYSGDLINQSLGQLGYLLNPTPLSFIVYLSSGASTYPAACGGGTTTTTSTTTTTTTAAPTTTTTTAAPTTTTAAPTTTTAAPTTTTTTAAPTTTTTSTTTTTTTTSTTTTTTTTTTTAAPSLDMITINVGTQNYANGSGEITMFAWANAGATTVDTDVDVSFRWTGDLGSIAENVVTIYSGTNCGSITIGAGEIGEYTSTIDIFGFTPSTSSTQEYGAGSTSTGITSCP